ncbi:MAG: hypothetical protein K8I82_17395 [Anaerolineae bacterium]|jgi:transcriptional regulator with XRE-family HTH domain|nr:hypothetical protein [Anaerolineae bacterium]
MLDRIHQRLIGDYVQMQRLDRNLSLNDLARSAGISVKELMHIETGKTVSVLCLTGIARVFKMYTSDLIQAAIPDSSTDIYLDALFSEINEQ